MAFKYPEKKRIAGDKGDAGIFVFTRFGTKYKDQASHHMGWEHVSVSRVGSLNPPSWNGMCLVKDMFWGPEDLVVQLHPPASDYINIHPGVLHLWRKAGTNDFCEVPPKIMV